METRSTRPDNRILAIFSSLSLLLATAAWSADLDTILEIATVNPPARIGFEEQRFNPMFKEPMALKGYLEYLDNGVLRKVIEEPFGEEFLVEADHVIVSRDGKTHKLPLNRSRALRATLGAIESLLAGDKDRLAQTFDIELTGTDEAWILQMTPQARSVQRRLVGLEISGSDQAVSSIRINLPNDEWHLMTIGDDVNTDAEEK